MPGHSTVYWNMIRQDMTAVRRELGKYKNGDMQRQGYILQYIKTHSQNGN